ncbi:MAG: fumarylacetoacetate hydrolase family protein [Gammaproteobacteria bacterium]|nr:fumarylacetoacetate hydrolase family protein [Gammaproteobacteria bacterium]
MYCIVYRMGAARAARDTEEEHMSDRRARDAAERIWRSWERGECIDDLPESCRPRTLAEGYAAQAALLEVSGERSRGWKIAATSTPGQRHIGVDGPLAGRLLASKVHADGAELPMAGNHMRVAEAEFAFVLARDLPPRARDYTPQEVMDCVASLHPAIELPDSRFASFATAGGAQLVADDACARWFVLGEAADEGWRAERDGGALAAHPVRLVINGEEVTRGQGADVLGGPAIALAWLANCHAARGCGLAAGEIVTTGVCGRPSPIAAGDRLEADFGALGRVALTLGG